MLCACVQGVHRTILYSFVPLLSSTVVGYQLGK